jgi:hypothetical protein
MSIYIIKNGFDFFYFFSENVTLNTTKVKLDMNKNRRRTRNNERKKSIKVTRCKVLYRPVFEHETCSKFSSKVNSNNNTNCENCKHTF